MCARQSGNVSQKLEKLPGVETAGDDDPENREEIRPQLA
jgi:hypothetical protein